jgi:hypothetical protein
MSVPPSMARSTTSASFKLEMSLRICAATYPEASNATTTA